MTDRLLISPKAFYPPKIHQKVVLIFHLDHFFRFRELTGGSKIKSFGPSKRFRFQSNGEFVTVLGGLIGAPMAALAVEQACTWESKTFFSLGTAGWIGEREVEPGSCLSPQFGIDRTGVAAEYGEDHKRVNYEPFYKLPNCKGIVSINSFFSLTESKVRRFRTQKIDLIDMETAPLFLLTRLKKSRFHPLLVVSDRVSKNYEWINGSSLKSFQEGIYTGMELLLKTARNCK